MGEKSDRQLILRIPLRQSGPGLLAVPSAREAAFLIHAIKQMQPVRVLQPLRVNSYLAQQKLQKATGN